MTIMIDKTVYSALMNDKQNGAAMGGPSDEGGSTRPVRLAE